MKPLTIKTLFSVTAVPFILLFASGCTEKMSHHETVNNDVIQGVEQADSKAEHLQLAANYEAEANMLLEKARRHEKLASAYERTDNSKMVLGADAARHCRSIAKKYREAAAGNSALANLHRQQAEKLK